MANTKVSALTALAVEPDATDQFYINDGGVSKRIAWSVIKASAGSGDFKADGTVDMTGQFKTDVGTFASDVATGASAVAFHFTGLSYTTAGSKIFQVTNNTDPAFYIAYDGSLHLENYSNANYKVDILPSPGTFYFGSAATIAEFGLGTGRSLIVTSPVQYHVKIGALVDSNGFEIFPNARSDDNLGAPMYVRGGAALASAATNLDGGNLNLAGGAGSSASAGDADGGHVLLDGGQGYGTGSHGDVVIGNTRGDLQFNNDYVVASLPTGVVGKVARVTNALTPVLGATVAGGGAAHALVWYNNANWTVIGV